MNVDLTYHSLPNIALSAIHAVLAGIAAGIQAPDPAP